jgi:hypothetical protein
MENGWLSPAFSHVSEEYSPIPYVRVAVDVSWRRIADASHISQRKWLRQGKTLEVSVKTVPVL